MTLPAPIQPRQGVLTWHSSDDPPGEAENALIATDYGDSPGNLYLAGMAVNRNGVWYSEIFDDAVTPPFWWLDERDLLALIPK